MASEFGTEWCPECRAKVDVEDRFTESRYERSGEYEFQVVLLSCGHSEQHGDRCVGPAPGAPYAGPGVAVAATSQPWDMRAAAARQDALDHPWGWEADL